MAQGTIKVTNGSVDVVGTGTAFTAMKPGSFLTFVLVGVAYTVAIDSVQSTTALKLAVKFDGPTTSGVAFDESPVGSMALATMGVTVQAQKALRMMIADATNWREVFSNKQTITVTLPDGSQYSGYSWGYISDQLKNIDLDELHQIRDDTVAAKNQAQGFASAASGSATAAQTARTGAETARTGAETARTQAQTAQQGAAASATTSTTQAGIATTQAGIATTQAGLAKNYADSINPDNLLAKANNLSDLPDKAQSRENIGLGTTSDVRFGVARISGAFIDTIESGTAPSAPFVSRLMSGSGVVRSQVEVRAEYNGNVSLINRSGSPQFASLTTSGDWLVSAICQAIRFEATAGANCFASPETSGMRTTISAESGYAMLWRKRGAGVSGADEFIGIRSNGDFIFRKSTGATTYVDAVTWHTSNTTVDSSGFIKRASPIVKLMGDGSFELNEESEGLTVEKIGTGLYKICGCLGMNSDLAWGGISGGIESPKDINGQPVLWVDYSVGETGDIVVKTYHRENKSSPEFARNVINGVSEGDPIDIPGGSFISVRVEMPDDSKYNQWVKLRDEEAERAMFDSENTN